jgi:hypothetical protein
VRNFGQTRTDKERQKEKELFLKSAKQEVIDKRSGSFDTTKLSKTKQRILSGRLNYIYKEKKDIKELQNINLTEDEIQARKGKEELLKSSMIVINKSVDAKRLIEDVIERVSNNKQVIEDLAEKKQMNGHVYKAYKNLFNKGKEVEDKTIVKKKITKAEQLYDHVYFKLPKHAKNVGKTQYHPFLMNED